jgi:uncharacterized protein (TIGR02466 family)
MFSGKFPQNGQKFHVIFDGPTAHSAVGLIFSMPCRGFLIVHIKSLFVTPLIVCEMPPESPLVANLQDAIVGRVQQDQGVMHSNLGGWQSDVNALEWLGEAGQMLIAEVTGIIDRMTVVLTPQGLQAVPIDWKVDAWANVSNHGHQNAGHYHPGSYWSAVFYVDDGGINGRDHIGGAIEFNDPRGPAPVMAAPTVKMALAGCLTAGLGERHFPKTGELLIFPSWLHHSVTPYFGNSQRISIAMNFAAR